MIRLATPDDVPRLVDFEAMVADRRLYGPSLDAARLRSEIGDNEYYINDIGGEVVGTGAYRWRANSTAHVSNIAVAPKRRRQGYGREMLEFLINVCGAAATMELAVHPANEIAVNLYASNDFHVVEQRENYFGDGEPRLIMVRNRKFALDNLQI